MARDFSMKCNVKGAEEFHSVLMEYAKWTKRQPADIINAKLYFIAANATNTTKVADKNKIEMDLRAASKTNPKVPLVAILVNKDQRNKHKQGLSGPKMVAAIDKYIRRAKSFVGATSAQWLACMKKLDYWNKQGDITFVKRFAPKPRKGLKVLGKPKSETIAAKPNLKVAYGKIANLFGQGKQASSTIHGVMEKGLALAINTEMKSMRMYIQRKLQEKFNKVNKSTTVS